MEQDAVDQMIDKLDDMVEKTCAFLLGFNKRKKDEESETEPTEREQPRL